MKYYCFIFISVFSFSCGFQKEDKKNEIINSDTAVDTFVIETAVDTETLDSIDTLQANIDSIKIYLLKASLLRQDLERKLKETTPQQADSIYWDGDFWFTETDEFQHIVRLTTPAIERWGINGGEIGLIQDDELLKILSEEGIEPEYLGEGYAELRINAYYYYNIFKPYLSDENREFLKLTADNDYIIEMDAGLVVPIDSLISKCIRWETFLNKYPQVEQRKIIISQYGFYMGLIMFCTYDNTRAFDVYTNRADEYVVNTIKKSIQKYGDCQTTKIFSQYIKDLDKSDYKYSKRLENKIMMMGLLKDFDRETVYY